MAIFSVLYSSHVWDMEKMFPMLWSLTALYYFRGSRDILKNLGFKNFTKAQIFKSKTVPKIPYTRILYNATLLE